MNRVSYTIEFNVKLNSYALLYGGVCRCVGNDSYFIDDDCRLYNVF